MCERASGRQTLETFARKSTVTRHEQKKHTHTWCPRELEVRGTATGQVAELNENVTERLPAHPILIRTGPNQNRTEPNRTNSNRTELNRIKQNQTKPIPNRIELNRTESNRTELKTKPNRSRTGRNRIDSKPNRTELNRTERSRTKRNRTEPIPNRNRTKLN